MSSNMSEDTPQQRPPQRAGEVYGTLLVSLLSELSARQSSIEQRALAVITTSGVLVSLLAGLSALLLERTRRYICTPRLERHSSPRSSSSRLRPSSPS